MSQALLIQDDESLSALYSLNLQIYTGTDVIIKKTAQEALNVLEVVPELDIIISKAKINSEETAFQIFSYLKEAQRNIPLIVLGVEERLRDQVVFFSEAVDLKPFIQQVAKLLGVTPRDMIKKIVPDFIPVQFESFLQMDSLPCDVYMKTGNIKNGFHYVKKLIEGDQAEERFIKTMTQMGATHLYVVKEDRVKFTKTFSAQLINKLSQEKLTFDERVPATQAAYDLTSSTFKNDGFSEENMEMVNASLDSVSKIVGDSASEIKPLLDRLMKLKTGYIFKHVVVTSYLCTEAIKKMHGDSAAVQKYVNNLCFASFFHDIMLENEVQAKIRNEDQMHEAKLSDKEKQLVLKHPQLIAEMVKKVPNIPIGVDKIIIQHHGSLTGVGFPDVPHSGLSQLSYVFMACEAYGDEILKLDATGKKWEFSEVVENLPEHLKGPKLKNILQYLKD